MLWNDLPELLDRLAKRPILVVGDAMLDQYVYGTTTRVSREAPVPIVRFDSEEHRLGGAANAARNVASLGGKVSIAAVAGEDAEGEALQVALKQASVATGLLLRERGRTTLTKLRVLAGAAGTAKQQMLRLDREPQKDPSPVSQRRLLARLEKKIPSCAGILVSDYGGGTITPAVIKMLKAAARSTPVVVDSRYRLLDYRGPFILKPNLPELVAATGKQVRLSKDVESASRLLLEKCAAKAVVATQGRAGMTLVQPRKKAVRVPVFGSDDVADVTGAGDTVAASMVLALAAGAPLATAMNLATVAAGLVVQRLGAAAVSCDEIRAALE